MADIKQKLKTAANNPWHVPMLIIRRLRTSFSYHLSSLLNDWAALPETVNIYPTTRCNLKCNMCFAKLYRSKTELGINEWMDIIDRIQPFHPRIHISGGEPFVYPYIIDLIGHIKRKGFFLHITTNGTFLNQHADQIIDLGINRIDISIDGTQEVHDKVRGVPGTFKNIAAGLELLRTKKGKSRTPAIRINSIINFDDFTSMEKVINLGKSWGMESILFIYPLYLKTTEIQIHRKYLKDNLGLDLHYWKNADHFKPVPADFNRAWSIIRKLYAPGLVKVEVFPRFTKIQFEAFYQENTDFYASLTGTCKAMWNTATILPTGEIESCPDYIIGNCREENFAALWNSDKMKVLRRRIKDRQFFSVCRACCFFYT